MLPAVFLKRMSFISKDKKNLIMCIIIWRENLCCKEKEVCTDV